MIAAARWRRRTCADGRRRRVEGTLFGNGERTGNVCVLTLAANLWSQGVDPQLDLSEVNELVRMAEYCTQLPVHPRHPYAGELVFTAFSGSHQDAINKGFKAMEASGQKLWEVPYSPIDPKDLGRSYEAVIRINSQSGKGGIAYVLEKEHGIELPRRAQIEFSKVVQAVTDAEGIEVTARTGSGASSRRPYLDGNGRYGFISHLTEPVDDDPEHRMVVAKITDRGEPETIKAKGNGPIDGFVAAIRQDSGLQFDVVDYREHAIGSGANAAAVAYVEIKLFDGRNLFGVGIDRNIVAASLKAVVSAVNRGIKLFQR